MDSMGLTRYMSVLMDDAMKQARFFDHEFVMPEHMLLALLRQYAFCQALQEEGVDSLKMHEDLVGWLAKQERVPETIKYLPEPSSLFKTMFGTACALAAAADRQLVNVPHFVQAMFGLQNSEAAFLLCKNVGDRQGEFLASVDSYYPIGEDTGEAGMGMGADFDDDDYANEYDDDEEEGRRQVVQDWHQLVTCISDKVEEHNPLIGREQELDRTIQVLCRAEKNNPLHIGEAGVGKTALVYGLAKLINENQVPERLKGARIYGMDMGQMLAGAQYRGDFEKRIKMVMEGAVKEGNTIIYIDEIHNMIGAGRGSDGGPDASNMLKQYLEAGDIRFIGSTTYEEYNRYMAQSKGIVRRFQQIDIKEPTEKHTVAKLIGSPAGYVGYEDGGLLTDAIRKTPNCVLLLDEIEKAHSDIYNILLQVMDYARLTDNKGQKADFRNVILIMTSNAGAQYASRASVGFNGNVSRGDAMLAQVKKTFKPEFINRLSDMVVFNDMDKHMAELILAKKLRQLDAKLAAKGVTVTLTDAAREQLLKWGFTKEYGAREMDRVIGNRLKPILMKALLFGKLKKGGKAHVDFDGKELVINY